MPLKDEHHNKAQHNARFANKVLCEGNLYLDWVATAYFYSALHYVDAYLATLNIHPVRHVSSDRITGRDTYVHRHIRNIYDDYRDLKYESNQSRYYLKSFNASEVVNDLKPLLDKIKSEVNSLL